MTQHSAPRTPHVLLGVAVALGAAVVSANALANGLVWDDPIVLNRQLLAFQSVRDLIFLPRNIPQFSPDYYRPLTIVSYLIDHAIGGASPFVFHASVLLYHVVTTYWVFRLGLVLFAGSTSAMIAAGVGAALFAVHPIHAESVAWGAGRSDVLAGAFGLAGIVVYRHERWTALRRATVAAALVFIATLAKETAAALLVLAPVMDLVLGTPAAPIVAPAGRAERRRQQTQVAAPASPLRTALPFAVAAAVYVALRRAALHTTFGGATGLGTDLIPRLLGAIGLYLGKLILPIRQSAYISDLPSGPLALLLAGAAIALVCGGGVVAWRRGERCVTFLLLWIGVTLAPSLAIVVKIPFAPVAERYLYLPSVGFCLLVGYAASWIVPRAGRAAVIAVVVLLLCAGAAASIRRNAVWRSNLTLWEDTAAKNTSDGLPMRGLATAYQQLGNATKAAEYFQLALQRHNDPSGQFTIYNNLGSLAMTQQKLDEAERYYRQASALNPQAPECFFNLGLIALTRAKEPLPGHDAAWQHSQAQRARQLFEQSIQLNPIDPDAHVALGQTFMTLDDGPAARAHFERALQLGLSPATETSVRKLLADLAAN